MESVIAGTEPRYRSAALRRASAEAGKELVEILVTGEKLLVPSMVGAAVDCCRSFATIAQHASRVCQAFGLGADGHGNVTTMLQACATHGLLVSHDEIVDRASRERPLTSSPPTITSLGVVTRNRPASLNRTVRSFAADARRHDRVVRVVVADSSDEEQADDCRDALVALNAEYGVRATYVGERGKHDLIHRLSRSGAASEEVLEFLLFGCGRGICSTGANRNAVLLSTMGECLLSVDDDVSCTAGVAFPREQRLAFASDPSFVEWLLFPDRATALRSVSFVEDDVVALHEALLGSNLSDCIRRHGAIGPLDSQGFSHELFEAIQRRRGATFATVGGIVGDSGCSSMTAILMSTGSNRARLVESEAFYRVACSTREVVRVSRGPTITDHPYCMGQNLGLDNRRLLPPFLPIGRNQDGLFGLLARKCLPDGYIGHVPSVLVHAPESSRVTSEPIWKNAAALTISDVITMCIQSVELGGELQDPESRLVRVGAFLAELGGLNETTFFDLFESGVRQVVSDRIAGLKALLDFYNGEPSFWAEDIRRVIGVLQEGLQHSDWILPRDISGSVAPPEARAMTHQCVRLFGEALQAWPAIVAATPRA